MKVTILVCGTFLFTNFDLVAMSNDSVRGVTNVNASPQGDCLLQYTRWDNFIETLLFQYY